MILLAPGDPDDRPQEGEGRAPAPERPRSGGQAGAPASGARLWGLALAAGLVAGLASWGAGEAVAGRFDVPLANTYGDPEAAAENIRQIQAASAKSAAVSYGLLGAAMGFALGLSGGLARGSARSGLAAGVLGLALATASGAAASLALVPTYFAAVDRDSDDLILPMLIHGGIWVPIGALGGLAFGLGMGGGGRAARALAGGLLGAALATATYEVAGALAFPIDKTGEPMPSTWGPRLLAHLSVASLASSGIAAVVRGKGPDPAPVEPASRTTSGDNQ